MAHNTDKVMIANKKGKNNSLDKDAKELNVKMEELIQVLKIAQTK